MWGDIKQESKNIPQRTMNKTIACHLIVLCMWTCVSKKDPLCVKLVCDKKKCVTKPHIPNSTFWNLVCDGVYYDEQEIKLH